MLFGVGLATKIYLAVEAVDMRKGFEGSLPSPYSTAVCLLD